MMDEADVTRIPCSSEAMIGSDGLPESVRDAATYDDPIRQSVGIRHVFVNGQIALARCVTERGRDLPAILRNGALPCGESSPTFVRG